MHNLRTVYTIHRIIHWGDGNVMYIVCLFVYCLFEWPSIFTTGLIRHYRAQTIIHFFIIHDQCNNNYNVHIENAVEIVNTWVCYKWFNMDSVKNRSVFMWLTKTSHCVYAELTSVVCNVMVIVCSIRVNYVILVEDITLF